MSVTPEEKMKLMLELGLENAASKWAEANNLTAMRFSPINSEKIEELLAVEYQEMGDADPGWPLFMLLPGSVTAIFATLVAHSVWPNVHSLVNYTAGVPMLLSLAIGYFLSRPKMEMRTADVCQMPLSDWEDNLPYGALLSVKEAKTQGYYNFTIFFPAKDDSRYAKVKRLKEDPIIVANKKGHRNKMYNIFAWDDGKIYD